MTYPFEDYGHVHVSENETGLDEDCLWCSAVEVLRYGGLDIPATLKEAEAMRAASGEPPEGGSNLVNLQDGALARYGVELPRFVTGSTGLLRIMPPNTAAVITGRLSNFPLGHTLRRHLPLYTGGHAVALYRIDDLARFWWCDPLAPADYDGQWVGEDQVRTFMQGFGDFTTVTRDEYAIPDTGTEEPVIKANYSALAGKATAIRPGHRFDVETHQPTPFATGFTRNVVTTATLAEALSASLQPGELMLVTTWGDPDRLEMIRATDTDWPKGKATCPPEDCTDEVNAAVAATKASAKVVFV